MKAKYKEKLKNTDKICIKKKINDRPLCQHNFTEFKKKSKKNLLRQMMMTIALKV